MISSQRSPLWPYLLVLSALFMLSLAVPRGWQQESNDDWHPLARRAQIRRRMSTDNIAIVRPSSENLALPETWQSTSEVAKHDHWTGQQLADDMNGPSANFIAPLAETVAKKIADFRRFRAMHSAAENDANGSEANGTNGSDLQDQLRILTAEQKSNAIASAYWPVPNSLLAQLNKLAQDNECQAWAQRVENLCLELCQSSPGDLKGSEAIVQQLESLEQEAGTLDHTLKNDKTASEFRRVHYALRRRLALWSAAFSAQQQSEVFANVTSTDVQRQRLGDALKAADDWIGSLSYADAWRKYLMLDELHQLTDANNPITSEQSQRIARQALARMLPAQMDDQQRRILGDRTILEVADQLRSWANESSDVREVLASIEQYESSGLPSDAKRVAVGLRKLNWSALQQDRQMAQKLDEHYRNANIRIAMTNDFLNRLGAFAARRKRRGERHDFGSVGQWFVEDEFETVGEVHPRSEAIALLDRYRRDRGFQHLVGQWLGDIQPRRNLEFPSSQGRDSRRAWLGHCQGRGRDERLYTADRRTHRVRRHAAGGLDRPQHRDFAARLDAWCSTTNHRRTSCHAGDSIGRHRSKAASDRS